MLGDSHDGENGTLSSPLLQNDNSVITSNESDMPELRRHANTLPSSEQEAEQQQQNQHLRQLQQTNRQNRHHNRLLDRDGAFYQSNGKWWIQRVSQRMAYRKLATKRQRCVRLWQDWFHSLSYKPTIILLLIIFVAYTTAVIFFACIYRLVNIIGAKEYTTNDDGTKTTTSFCGMDITNKMEALYFSLSTMTTIGYGVSDYYFGDCWTPLLLVLWQVCTALTFDAVAIGLIFTRISRGQKRGKTIIFSNNAVIRRVKNQLYFMFRVGELRRQHIIEANVRVYCLRHERHPTYHDNRTSRNKSGTTNNAEVVVPTTAIRNNTQINTTNTNVEGSNVNNNNELRRRGSTQTSRTATTEIETYHFITKHMKLCFPNEDHIGSHILMNLPQVIVHKMDSSSPLIPPKPYWYDSDGCRHELILSSTQGSSSNTSTYRSNNINSSDIEIHEQHQQKLGCNESCYIAEKNAINRFMLDRETEIIVIVEGTDEVTGSALQARHSYCYDDLIWDHNFESCIYLAQQSNNNSNSSSSEEESEEEAEQVLNDADFIDEYENADPNGNAQDEERQRRQGLISRPWGRRQRSTKNACCVDYSKFHCVKPVPTNCDSCPYTPQP